MLLCFFFEYQAASSRGRPDETVVCNAHRELSLPFFLGVIEGSTGKSTEICMGRVESASPPYRNDLNNEEAQGEKWK